MPEVLEVDHLDGDRGNNYVENLATLCPNCRIVNDIGPIPTTVVAEMRDCERSVDWSIRVEDASKKQHKPEGE